MTTNDRDAVQSSPLPWFSAWSPLIAVAGALSTEISPGWLVVLVWVVGVLCALPFKKFRLVVPLALVTWLAGWLVSLVFLFTEMRIVGLFIS